MMNGASIMMKLLFGSFAVLMVMSAIAFGHLNLAVPHAAIEYNAAEAVTLHGSSESFNKTAPILLHDVFPGSGTYWLSKTVTQLSTLRGYAHIGGLGGSQQQANANVTLIQIWGWLDTNGNGQADEKDTTTAWEKLTELTPSTGNGNVVGYEIAWPPPAIHTSTWQGDLLQGNTIPLKPGQSWLLLIRVVDISGNTNLMAALAGLEQWDNGLADGVGSDVITDRFVDSNGNTPETTDGRIEDDDVVWLYVPRLK